MAMLNDKDFSQLALGEIAKRMQSMIHPVLYERMMREVGSDIGRQLAGKTPTPSCQSHPLTQEDYSQYREWLKSACGWVSDIAVNESTSTIDVCVPRCPFGNLPLSNPHLCHLEAGLFGGVAGDQFGYAKTSIARGPGNPPGNCRLSIHLEQTPESLLIEGPSFPLEAVKTPRPDSRGAEERISVHLSLRERQIIKLIGEGLSDKEIAGALNLSVRTVEGHLARIRDKTSLRSRGAMIRFALQVNGK